MNNNFDLIAEQHVIASILIDNEAYSKISDVLVVNDFYHIHHKVIFEKISQLSDKNIFIDPLIVAEELEKENLLQEISFKYIHDLALFQLSSARVRSYAEIVLEKSTLRKINDISSAIHESVNEKVNAKEILKCINEETKRLEERINALSETFEHIKPLMMRNIELLTELNSREADQIGKVPGLSTGIETLDNIIGGLMPGKLIVVAGRPGMGKSALAMNFCEHVGIYEKKTVAVFSLEMPAEELSMRMIGSVGKVNSENLRNGNLHENDWIGISNAMGKLIDSEIYFDSTPNLSFNFIAARLRKLKRNKNLGLVVIDYLQLMAIENKSNNRAADIGDLTRNLKMLSVELGIPIILLSQLNRKCEERPNKRPMPSDLRDSGSIEQDADILIFIYRDEKYNPESEDKGKAELIIAKQRGGKTGTLKTRFEGEYTKFSDLNNGQTNFNGE